MAYFISQNALNECEIKQYEDIETVENIGRVLSLIDQTISQKKTAIY